MYSNKWTIIGISRIRQSARDMFLGKLSGWRQFSSAGRAFPCSVFVLPLSRSLYLALLVMWQEQCSVLDFHSILRGLVFK